MDAAHSSVDDVTLADERGGEQRRHGDDVGVDLVGLVDELEEVHVDAEIVDLVARRLEEQLEDVLADRVQVALDGAQHHDALLGAAAAGFLDQRLENAHRRLEGERRLHQLGQEDLLVLELLADDVQAGQQALVDDLLRAHAVGERLVDGLEHGVLVLVDDGLLQLVMHRFVSHE
jgi:hypothetical protein